MKTALAQELAGLPGRELRSASARLSGDYRQGVRGESVVRYEADALAYAAARLPATWAAVRSALGHAAQCLQGFSPRSVLDAGAGPGTACWAALELWPGLEKATLLEREPCMVELGRRLAQNAGEPLRGAVWLNEDLTGGWQAEPHDAVILSYALNELPEKQREKTLLKLWEATAGLLLIVEPGTPEGFSHILQARELFAQSGGLIAAPCPHAGPCPMASGNWCHFSVRVARSRVHRQAKGAEMSYEDEKFSYIAVTKNVKAKPCEARVLRHPQIYKGHLGLELCASDGLKRVTVAKSRGQEYKKARGLEWGDPF